MIANLSLFALAISKTLLWTGLGPAVMVAVAFERAAKFWTPLKVGKVYRISGYHVGDFVGEVEAVSRNEAHVRVLDPMRPAPRVRNRCCFPECLREDFHGGEHEFARVREGALVEVSWALAKWAEVSPQASGGRQLAKTVSMPDRNSATSLPRKVRRSA
jgi:hypothetical protein